MKDDKISPRGVFLQTKTYLVVTVYEIISPEFVRFDYVMSSFVYLIILCEALFLSARPHRLSRQQCYILRKLG